MEPRLIEMDPGGWLALTPPDAPVALGVFGSTAAEARQRLDDAIKAREVVRAESQ